MDKIELMNIMCDHAAAMVALQLVMVKVITQAKNNVDEETWKEFMAANSAIQDVNKRLRDLMQKELN